MPSYRAFIAVGFWSAAHFIVALSAAFVSLLFGSHVMDGGAPTSWDRVTTPIVYVLMSPGLPIALHFGIHNDLAEWSLVLGNSVLWGIALFWLARLLRSAGRTPD